VSGIHVTTDGDTHWLECFADDPDAEHGTVVAPVEPGDAWNDLGVKVRAHEAGHRCGVLVVLVASPELPAAMAESRKLREVLAEMLTTLLRDGQTHAAARRRAIAVAEQAGIRAESTT
jgi:hypothetical protein